MGLLFEDRSRQTVYPQPQTAREFSSRLATQSRELVFAMPQKP